VRRILTGAATCGDVVAMPIFNERGVAIVQGGVRLSERLIRRLEEEGVRTIFVHDPRLEGLSIREGLSPLVHSQLRGYLGSLIAEVRRVKDPQRVPLSLEELVKWSRAIVSEVEAAKRSFLLYVQPEDPVEAWIARSINNAMLGAATYLYIGGREQAQHIAMAALIQDLGVWTLDEPEKALRWLNRPELAMSDFRADAVLHVLAVQKMLTRVPGVNAFVKAVAAQHHERLDGSGYPKGRRGDAVHPMARVMGVVDTYVSLAMRPDDPMLPHEALEFLMAGVGFEFDHAAVKAFRNAIHPYPVGTEVLLNTGEKGVVCDVPGPVAVRPCVRVLWTEGEGEVEPYDVNLTQETTRSIVRVLNQCCGSHEPRLQDKE